MASDEDGKKSDIPDNIVGPERTLLQMWSLFFGPEIERRQALYRSHELQTITKAQVLFPEDEPPVVRLNDEVLISLLVRAPRGVFKGEEISLSEIEHIEGSELFVPDADAGHFTAILSPGGWHVFFDFRRNKGKALRLVTRAEEFLKSAKHALAEGLHGSAIDNLFSASELLAKAHLITSAGETSSTKNHRRIHSSINKWGKLGNIDPIFVENFNKLARMRESARYEGGDVSGKITPQMVDHVKGEIDLLRPRLKRFDD